MIDHTRTLYIKTALNHIYDVLKYIGINRKKSFNSFDECISDFSKELRIDINEFKDKLLFTPIDESKELNNYKSASYTIEYMNKKDIFSCDSWMEDITDDNKIFKKFKEKAQKYISELKKSSNDEITTKNKENDKVKEPVEQSSEKEEVQANKINQEELINDESNKTKPKENKEKEEHKEEITENELDRQLEILANTNKDKFNELVDDVNKTDETVRAVKLLNDDITFNWFKNTLPHTCEKFKKAIENNKDLLNKLNTFVKELDEKKVVNNDKEMSNEKENIDQSKNDKSPEEVQEEPLNQSEEENNSSDDESEPLPSLEEIESTIKNNKSSINDDIIQYIDMNNIILEDENELQEFINIFYDKYAESLVIKIKEFLENSNYKPKWLKYFYNKNKINELKEKFNSFNDVTSYVSEIGKLFIYNIFTTNTLLYLNVIKLLADDIMTINIIYHSNNNKSKKDDKINKILDKYPEQNHYTIKSIAIESAHSKNRNEQKQDLINRAKYIYKYIYKEGTLLDILELDELNKYYKEIHKKNKIIESSSLPYLPPVSYFLESMPRY